MRSRRAVCVCVMVSRLFVATQMDQAHTMLSAHGVTHPAVRFQQHRRGEHSRLATGCRYTFHSRRRTSVM